MGVEPRKIPLLAPTDSPTEPIEPTTAESGTDVDLATDVSRRTDKTSYTIPEDGGEITLPVKKRRDRQDRGTETRLTKSSNQSQTSLLIEYFEGGKDQGVRSRPSVRVKVTPSAARKIKNTNDHITVSESKDGRKPSYTRRISLGHHSPSSPKQITERASDDNSISSYTSAAEESSLSHRHPPVEIEVMGRDQNSDLSTLSDRQDGRLIQQNSSEISSMPPDSMLEEKPSSVTPTKNRSRSTSFNAPATTVDTLKTPSRRRSRSLSKERIAHKAMEKLAASESRESDISKQRRSSKTSRSRSVSSEQVESLQSPRRRSGKYQHDDLRSGTEASLATDSQLSAKRQSGDQYSIRSGTSRSSAATNPQLLETVEKAIRRLLPELEILKKDQKLQKTKQRFDEGSVTSGSSDKVARKVSKHSSAPDIAGRPQVVLQADENDPGTVLSGDSIKGRKEHRRSRKSDSPSERRSQREMSEETVIHDGGSSGRKRSKEGHHLRDATAGGNSGGVLTAAALNRHDMKHSESKSSVDSRERRRRRRSKSHSRSASLAESEDVFKKHDVPPMPMQSDIHSSDITRDSILSDETERTKSPAFEVQKAEVRHMARGSPREVSSGSRTPTKAKGEQLRKSSLGTHHSNLSQGDLSQGSPRGAQSPREESFTTKGEKGSIFGGGVAGSGAAFLAAREYSKRNSNGYDYGHEGRGLSPIQSVSSRQESEADRQSYRRNRSSTSLNDERQRRKSAASAKSETSVATDAFDRTRRPKGIHLEPGEDVLNQHPLRDEDYEEEGLSDQDPALNEWLQRQHEKNDEYRSTVGDENDGDPTVDYRHMTNYTDDSMDAPRLSQVVEGQKHQNVDARKNPDYRGTPVAVESAVASLLETSVLSTRSKGDRSFIDSSDKEAPRDSAYSASREVASREQSPIAKEQRHSPTKSYLHDLSAKGSPRQSVARSEDEGPEHGYSAVPTADNPIPEIGANLSGSDISTNPSFLQGPLEGSPHGNRDHWPYHPTPPQANDTFHRSKDSSAHESLKAAAARALSAAQVAKSAESSPDGKARSGAGPDRNEVKSNPSMEEGGYGVVDRDIGTAPDSYMSRNGIPSPPKDEGYVSGPQRGVQTPELAFKDATSFNDGGLDLDDPFVGTGHARHLSTNSGLARGMGSPLYDSATGNGIDRIQSKDIVALMDHLTVRDAQRNARDTEILVTLVRSAAEMRNSFEDMKKFIAEQDDLLAEANRKEHDNAVQKITLGGPRPQPNSAGRSVGRLSREEDSEDTANKRRNVFRRALQGLSSRNQNDVGKIEDMLHHLLTEVQDLKTGQDVRPSAGNVRAQTLNSYENLRATDPSTYEPQAQPGISSEGNSGYFSNPPSRGPSAMKSMGDRQASQNRVSTVLEADEELDEHDQQILDNQFEKNEEMLTPTRENPRPGSVPLATPPQAQLAAIAGKSTDNTPKTSAEKSRKHRSSNSSFFPKVSRWSRTTASSLGDNFRSGPPRRERPLSEASRSGDLQQYDTNDHYDHRGDDRIRSTESLESPSRRRQRKEPYIQEPLESPEEEGGEEEDAEEQGRPPSPLVPSHLSVSDDPKYQAHRNSLNLQHPQPRPGPTHRYQHALETKAKDYSGHSARSSPGLSPTSDSFGSDPTLSRFNMPGVRVSRYGAATGPGHLSPVVSDSGGYPDAGAAPPRPPKVKDNGPLVPQTMGPARPPKLAAGSSSTKPKYASPLSRTEEEDANRLSMASASDEVKGSPRSGKARRAPSGPRAMSGTYSRSSPRRTVSREKDASPVQSEDGPF